MVFSSYAFVLVFLPAVLAIFYGLRRSEKLSWSLTFLVLASWAFYAYYKPICLVLLFGSIVYNFFATGVMVKRGYPAARAILALSVLVNLGLLFWFKYLNFAASTLSALTGYHLALHQIVIPAGISFFTFQQIAYVVESFKTKTAETNFRNFALFISFFPHLLSGPIVNPSQTPSQFRALATTPIDPILPATGVILFTIGLAKKIILADPLGLAIAPIFGAADGGQIVDSANAWIATWAYTFQLYFDFSGYSDMAIGLALMFGIRLPINFNSPYKSRSVIEFWKRWHMTLGAWLRNYVYIPLGGSRNGDGAKLRNVFLTMFVCGVWHGAGWGFVIWGTLHAIAVTLNHAAKMWLPQLDNNSRVVVVFKIAFTLFFVAVVRVPFRAQTLSGSLSMWDVMFFGAPADALNLIQGPYLLAMTLLSAMICLFLPNSNEIVNYTADVSKSLLPRTMAVIQNGRLALTQSIPVAVTLGLLFAVSFAMMWRPKIFIYFNF